MPLALACVIADTNTDIKNSRAETRAEISPEKSGTQIAPGLRTANALAIAGGALAAAMLERLIEKNILTVADAKGILDNADSPLAPLITLTD